LAALKIDPGLGKKSQAMAEALIDSGLPPSMSILLIQSVCNLVATSPERNYGSRMKWFVAAMQNSYRHEIDKASNNIAYFKRLVVVMEDVTEIKDTLCGEGANISFQEAFILHRLGYNSDTLMALCDDIGPPLRRAARSIVKAAMAVESGNATTIEAALDYEHTRKYGSGSWD
jgi:hypothetical protein